MDKFQKSSDQDPTTCTECGQNSLQRQMSAAAFSLKGTGWYVTDFKGDKKPKPTESNKADDKGGKESKKTEAKKDGSSSSKDNKTSGNTGASKPGKQAGKNDQG